MLLCHLWGISGGDKVDKWGWVGGGMEVNGKNIRGKGKSSLNLSSPTAFQVLEYLKKFKSNQVSSAFVFS